MLQHKNRTVLIFLLSLRLYNIPLLFPPWLFVNFFKKGAVIEAILVISNTFVQTNNLNGIDDKAVLHQQLINTSNVFFLYPHNININKKKKNTNRKVLFLFVYLLICCIFFLCSENSLKVGLKDERPLWPLSVFAPAKEEPNLVVGTDFSPEEDRMQYYMSMRMTNTPNQYVSLYYMHI